MKPDPQARPKRPATVWDQVAADGGASGGYDMAACVLVGLGLGWLLQHYVPACRPWGFVGGVVLGSASGFYQLFKTQSRTTVRVKTKAATAEKDDVDHERPV